jgi:hypothetical protein
MHINSRDVPAEKIRGKSNLHNRRMANEDLLHDTPVDGKGKRCEIGLSLRNLGLSHR